MFRVRRSWHLLVPAFVLLAVIMTGLQIWSAVSTQRIVSAAVNEATRTSRYDLGSEKARQDLIGQRITNDIKANIENNLATALGALSAVLISIFGAGLALFAYLNDRRKDRSDRTRAARTERLTREKEREDRLAAALSATLSRLVSKEPRERVVGAAGLMPFFQEDREDWHLQALPALIAAARFTDDPPAVRQSIRLAVEQAAKKIARDTRKQISWRGVQLPDIDLENVDLQELDLRDAVLKNARLRGANLGSANLTNSQLQGAQMQNVTLNGANLVYADLAGASLAGAMLENAQIDGLKVLNLDLANANLRNLRGGWRDVSWDAALNWRKARFDDAVRTELDAKYGPEVPPIRVLMLLWEIPPFVAGGTWTAAYHLVRNLRKRGADVTVVVPWEREKIIDNPFGVDVPIVALEIAPPDTPGPDQPDAGPQWSAYSPYGGSWSPYGDAFLWSPYGGRMPFQSPYGGYEPFWSPYGGRTTPSPYGGYESSWSPYGRGPSWSPYGREPSWSPYSPALTPASFGGVYGSYPNAGSYGRGSLSGSILYRLIGEYRRKLAVHVQDNPPDLVHAHDWVTFEAAETAANLAGIPWIAHFHSIEADRQPEAEDELTEQIEKKAVVKASTIIAPSRVTKERLVKAYNARAARINVIPNVLSEGASPASEMGRFETRRVVFLGRLSKQKGLDRFAEVAAAVRRNGVNASFEVYGDGEELNRYAGLRFMGPLRWDDRGKAFQGASALIVPSRYEPFGMVILEAMQHRVPVIFPKQSGAAEVLESGFKIKAEDIDAMTDRVIRILGNITTWEKTVRAEAEEIEAYPRRGYENLVIDAWQQSLATTLVQPKSP